eukprot:6174931-Pleurochrysis_carterae.AAC.2
MEHVKLVHVAGKTEGTVEQVRTSVYSSQCTRVMRHISCVKVDSTPVDVRRQTRYAQKSRTCPSTPKAQLEDELGAGACKIGAPLVTARLSEAVPTVMKRTVCRIIENLRQQRCGSTRATRVVYAARERSENSRVQMPSQIRQTNNGRNFKRRKLPQLKPCLAYKLRSCDV